MLETHHAGCFPDNDINGLHKRYNSDTASLRRGLVEHKIMERAGGGGDYWRTDL